MSESAENARLFLVTLTEDASLAVTHPTLVKFATTLSLVIQLWQKQAGLKDPINHAITFGTFSGARVTATLLQVMALFPENYQEHILVEHDYRFPVPGNYEDASWLSEEIMNVIVLLSNTHPSADMHFGHSLAIMSRDTMDQLASAEHNCNSWLEYLVKTMESGASALSWNPDGFYTIPATTKNLCFFWNHGETHWTVIHTNMIDSEDCWAHTIYNSMSSGSKGPSWKSAKTLIPFLEKLMYKASPGISIPLKPSKFQVADHTPQQNNSNDCGVFAIYNCVTTLNGGVVDTKMSARQLRLEYLSLILNHLLSLQSPPSPMFPSSSTMAHLPQATLATPESTTEPGGETGARAGVNGATELEDSSSEKTDHGSNVSVERSDEAPHIAGDTDGENGGDVEEKVGIEALRRKGGYTFMDLKAFMAETRKRKRRI